MREEDEEVVVVVLRDFMVPWAIGFAGGGGVGVGFGFGFGDCDCDCSDFCCSCCRLSFFGTRLSIYLRGTT